MLQLIMEMTLMEEEGTIMKKIIAMIVLIFATSTLTGCTTGERNAAGVAGGAVVGGLAGSALTGGSAAGTIIGAGIGGYAGYELVQ